MHDASATGWESELMEPATTKLVLSLFEEVLTLSVVHRACLYLHRIEAARGFCIDATLLRMWWK
jgi:hypothetical protein